MNITAKESFRRVENGVEVAYVVFVLACDNGNAITSAHFIEAEVWDKDPHAVIVEQYDCLCEKAEAQGEEVVSRAEPITLSEKEIAGKKSEIVAALEGEVKK